MAFKRAKWPIKFPHISHRIPEGIFLVLLILNTLFAFLPPRNGEMSLRMEVIKNPFSVLPHQNLANYYLNSNLTEAEKEFLLAESFYQTRLTDSDSTNLLGVESSPLTIWNNLLTYREKIIRKIESWENLEEKYPDYEFAKLKLASFYYQLGDYESARSILQKLLTENPTLSEAKLLYSKLP